MATPNQLLDEEARRQQIPGNITGDTVLGQGPPRATISDIIARTLGNSGANGPAAPGTVDWAHSNLSGGPDSPDTTIAARWIGSGEEGPMGSPLLSRLGLRQAQFAEKEHMDAAHELLAQHGDARAQAEAYFKIAKAATDLQHETKSHVDSAGFLNDLASVSPSDPQYDTKIAALSAKYPFAKTDLISPTLNNLHDARQVYTKAGEHGGINEFTGPARDTFASEMAEHGDLLKARAAATNVAKGEQDLLKAYQSGLIKDTDFVWNDESPKDSKLFKASGDIDYDAVRELAAKRQGGSVTGALPNTKDASEARSIVASLGKRKEDLDDDEKAIYQGALTTLRQFEQGKGGALPAAKAKTAADYRSGF